MKIILIIGLVLSLLIISGCDKEPLDACFMYEDKANYYQKAYRELHQKYVELDMESVRLYDFRFEVRERCYLVLNGTPYFVEDGMESIDIRLYDIENQEITDYEQNGWMYSIICRN